MRRPAKERTPGIYYDKPSDVNRDYAAGRRVLELLDQLKATTPQVFLTNLDNEEMQDLSTQTTTTRH